MKSQGGNHVFWCVRGSFGIPALEGGNTCSTYLSNPNSQRARFTSCSECRRHRIHIRQQADATDEASEAESYADGISHE